MKDWVFEKKYYIAACMAAAVIFLYTIQKEDPQPIIAEGKAPVLAANEKVDSKEPELEDTETSIMVDVKGAVNKPGVYNANKNERVIDMVERAGGLSRKADASQVNFAQKLEDEMVIYIPVTGENGEAVMPLNSPAAEKAGKININKANANELQEIPGIGPAKAAAIIEYRESNGPYKETEDLKEVSGIGDKTFEKLESFITVR